MAKRCVALLLAAVCAARTAYGHDPPDCPADGTAPTHTNSVWDASAGASTAAAGPRLPELPIRHFRTYGAVGSCVGSAAEGFDGGEITVASTIGPHGTAYGKIMRYTAELFLDWLNLERPIPGTGLIGGLMVGGRRYSMRYVWAGDESADTAAAAVAHSMRREDAHFAWGGYGSTVSRLQAEQTELDGKLLMASIAAGVNVFRDRDLTFGTLPPAPNYIQNAVRTIAAAATGVPPVPPVDSIRVGLLYTPPLDEMCEPIGSLSLGLGMSVSAFDPDTTGTQVWLANSLPKLPSAAEVDAVLNRLREDGVNVIIGCTYVTSGLAVIEGLERLDYSPLASAFTSTVDISVYQARVQQEGWWQGEYQLGVSPWHQSLRVRGEFSGWTSTEYVDRYWSRFGEVPSYHGPASFAAACALAAAIEAADSLDTNDVAASLRTLRLQEFGFGAPMDFEGPAGENEGQNNPDMLVLQTQSRRPNSTTELTIVYPPALAAADINFPTPPWGKRRCVALGSGALYSPYSSTSSQAGLIRPTECSGNGRCEPTRVHEGRAVYECACSHGWSGENCEQSGLNLTIALLYAHSSDSDSPDDIAAAQIGLDMVQADDDVLPDFQLNAVLIDTSRVRTLNAAGSAEANLQQYVDEEASAVGLQVAQAGAVAAVGAGYSSDAIAISPALGGIPLLSFSATAAVLSNSSQYPNFGRLCMPDAQQALALADLAAYTGWTKIVMIHCDDVYCRGLAQDTREALEQLGVHLDGEYVSGGITTKSDAEQLMATVQLDITDCNGWDGDPSAGIILLDHDQEGRLLLEAAATLGIRTSWLTPDGIGSRPLEAALEAVGEVISVRPGGVNTRHDKYRQLVARLPQSATDSYTMHNFDAIWTLAYALDAAIRRGSDATNGTAVLEAMHEVEFDGASGEVIFDSNLDRRSSYDIIVHRGDSVGAFCMCHTATHYLAKGLQTSQVL